MESRTAVDWLDQLVFNHTGDRLSELQRLIVEQVWQGHTYTKIADTYCCTEGHAKDVGSDLWKLLSRLLGTRVTKKNVRLLVQQHLQPQRGDGLSTSTEELLGFVGRQTALMQLATRLQQGAKVIVIQGEGGLGKTTLAQHYLHHQGFEQVLELLIAKDAAQVTPAAGVVAEWLRCDFQEEPGLDFGITLERLKRHLRRRKVGILIDNLEPALDAQGQFLPAHRDYIELLRILSDPQTQSVTLLTSRDRLCEPSLSVTHYRLSGLALDAWQQFFAQQHLEAADSALAALHHAYGGNAKAMGIVAGAIQTDYDGEIAAYWHHSREALLAPLDLKNLVDGQLQRLQHLDPNAYRLFCRLGCYRYLDIPAVPLAGVLALLWDVPDPQRRSALMALQNRSLVEVRRGAYSLHPVLQEAALVRLRASPDWAIAHSTAAAFWSNHADSIQTTQDALHALEAFYHYRAIEDYASAGRVILQSRLNQWHQHLPLGSTLYRMGLLQPLLRAIPEVLAQVPPDPAFSELHNILGDVYWITGQVHRALKAQETALRLAEAALAELSPSESKRHHYYQMLGVDSRLSMGLYCLDLWELDRAAAYFEQVMVQVKGTAHDRWADKATVCLALTQSHLGQHAAAHQKADAIYQTLLRDRILDSRGSAAYFMQLLGQTYVNLNLFETAEILFEKTLSFSESSHYTQIQGRTLTGLAIIQRQRGNLFGAIALHRQAIALLENLGAQCDLAEAYYQLGLTYQQADDSQSQTFMQQAIACFEAIQAPRQVAKVVAKPAQC